MHVLVGLICPTAVADKWAYICIICTTNGIRAFKLMVPTVGYVMAELFHTIGFPEGVNLKFDSRTDSMTSVQRNRSRLTPFESGTRANDKWMDARTHLQLRELEAAIYDQ